MVFTDLDGTLLDARTYRFEAALPAVRLLRSRGVPLVLCSSKTRPEIEEYRERLRNHDPFVYENGGGVCVPPGAFPFAVEGDPEDGCTVLRLGTRYAELRAALGLLRRDLGVRVTGFGDLTAEGVARVAGLPPEEAELARRREFDEPFFFEDPGEPRAGEFLRAIEERGLRWTRGRFHHVLGDCDKGRAVRILTAYYRRLWPTLLTVGLGDAPNDRPLLEAVDVPVLVQREDGTHAAGPWPPRVVLADAPGPVGWNRVILGMFSP